MNNQIINQMTLYSRSIAPMGGELDYSVKLLQKAAEIPFEVLEVIDPYNLNVDPRGRKPLPTRMAYAAFCYQNDRNLSDSELIEAIGQSHYCQAFCGFTRLIMPDEVFAESDLRNLRKRYPNKLLDMVNEIMSGARPAAAINDKVWRATWEEIFEDVDFRKDVKVRRYIPVREYVLELCDSYQHRMQELARIREAAHENKLKKLSEAPGSPGSPDAPNGPDSPDTPNGTASQKDTFDESLQCALWGVDTSLFYSGPDAEQDSSDSDVADAAEEIPAAGQNEAASAELDGAESQEIPAAGQSEAAPAELDGAESQEISAAGQSGAASAELDGAESQEISAAGQSEAASAELDGAESQEISAASQSEAASAEQHTGAESAEAQSTNRSTNATRRDVSAVIDTTVSRILSAAASSRNAANPESSAEASSDSPDDKKAKDSGGKKNVPQVHALLKDVLPERGFELSKKLGVESAPDTSVVDFCGELQNVLAPLSPEEEAWDDAFELVVHLSVGLGQAVPNMRVVGRYEEDIRAVKTIAMKFVHGERAIVDATVAPANIAYPTDVHLLNHARKILEGLIHKIWVQTEARRNGDEKELPYSRKTANDVYLNLAKDRGVWAKEKMTPIIIELLAYLKIALARFDELKERYPNVRLRKAVLRRVPVIRKLFEQQKLMCSQDERKCVDRIVSIYQEFLRPIFRGKLAHRNEFGQKLHLMDVGGNTFVLRTGWNNYSEGNDVPDVVRYYYHMFRKIPTALLCDLAYKSGNNQVFCRCMGIRFTGRRRGQTGAAAEAADNAPFAQQDANDRSIIEGRNGTLKTRYGLDLVLCVLEPTQRSVASMSVLNMNQNNRISRRLRMERDLETMALGGRRRPYRKTARC